MELKELLDLHEKLESRINAYWTYWSVAIFAIAGWLFSGKQALATEQAVSVSLAVGVFFCANLCVLWPATRLATGVREEIRLRSAEQAFRSPRLARAFASDDLAWRLQLTCALHLVVDAIVIYNLLGI